MYRISATYVIAWLVAVLIACTSGSLVFAQGGAPQPTPEQLENSATALVLIANDPTWRSVEVTTGEPDMTFRDLVFGWGQQSKETSELGKYTVGFIRMSGSSKGDTLGRLTVMSRPINMSFYGGRAYHQAGTRTKGDEAFDLAVRRLEKALTKIYQVKTEALVEGLKHAANQRSEAAAMIDRAKLKLGLFRQEGQELMDKLGMMAKLGIAPNAFSGDLDEQLGKLRQNLLTLRVELAGLNARHAAILKQIAMRKDRLSEAEQDQREYLNELFLIVKLREQQLALATARRDAAMSTSDVAEAEVQLSTARAELARQRQLVTQKAGSRLFDRLNGQLADVQIEMAAVEAQLQVVDEALKNLSSETVRGLSIEYDRAVRRLETALEGEKAAAVEVTRAERAIAAVPRPRVVIISQEKPSK